MTARLSPEESRAIGRAVGYVIRMLIHMGMWWTLAIVGVCTGAAYAWHTFPTWWDAFLDWMEQ